MPFSLPSPVLPFAEGGGGLSVALLDEAGFPGWIAAQGPAARAQIAESGFTLRPGKTFVLRGPGGEAKTIVIGQSASSRLADGAAAGDFAAKAFSKEFLKTQTFRLETALFPAAATEFATGWALSSYAFCAYKTASSAPAPCLVWPEGAEQDAVRAFVNGVFLTRDLINTPAADMGPQEMEDAACALASECGAEIEVTTGADLVSRNFPMIHAVGKGSPRAPRLIDLRRRKEGAPKVALVGKGICFDTGGLDIKPGNAMSLMKKDMGGAAHALGIFRTLCALDLPLDLRVLVPAAENAVSGEAFRPRDILRSRKGFSVEVLDTDAEGRLVLGDALAYACEEGPDFLIDFATLTGAARTALGFDIPALFASVDSTASAVQALALALDDPMWRLPLWKPYARELEGEISDLVNIGSGPAGSITAALFLEKFVAAGTDWVHLDLYAWEQTGKPGRPKGGAEMGFRTVLEYLRTRFCARQGA